jgi:hypothetical protein
MFDSIFIFLALLFVKHWYIDFVNQTDEEVQGKGTYGNAHGIMHSIKHGLGTGLVTLLFFTHFPTALALGFIDFLLHYHIDWAKMNINRAYNYTIQDKQFWAWLGADQLAHSLTYLLLVWVSV